MIESIIECSIRNRFLVLFVAGGADGVSASTPSCTRRWTPSPT